LISLLPLFSPRLFAATLPLLPYYFADYRHAAMPFTLSMPFRRFSFSLIFAAAIFAIFIIFAI